MSDSPLKGVPIARFVGIYLEPYRLGLAEKPFARSRWGVPFLFVAVLGGGILGETEYIATGLSVFLLGCLGFYLMTRKKR